MKDDGTERISPPAVTVNIFQGVRLTRLIIFVLLRSILVRNPQTNVLGGCDCLMEF